MILAVVTAGALLVAWATMTTPGPSTAAAPNTACEATMRRFYAAANEVLASGDPTSHDAVVAVDFVDHPVDGAAPLDRGSLGRSLLRLRAAAPAARFVVASTVVNGESGAARISLSDPDGRTFAGLPLTLRSAEAAAVDLFRLDGGLIAERWAGAPTDLPLPLPAASLPGWPERTLVSVARLTFPTDAYLTEPHRRVRPVDRQRCRRRADRAGGHARAGRLASRAGHRTAGHARPG
jgi:hypothetical protein